MPSATLAVLLGGDQVSHCSGHLNTTTFSVWCLQRSTSTSEATDKSESQLHSCRLTRSAASPAEGALQVGTTTVPAGEVPKCDMDTLQATASQLVDDMEETEAYADL